MVSLDLEALKRWDDAFLIVKLGTDEFAISVGQIDGISEFKTKTQEKLNSEFCLGVYQDQNKFIPVIDFRKYLHCLNSTFIPTLQSRILFVNISEALGAGFDTLLVGLVFDAIMGFYRNITSIDKATVEMNLSLNLKCFRVTSCVKINSDVYPILDLKKLIDFSSLKSLIKQ